MTDYLHLYEKFKDVKEVKDYIDDVTALRYYYRTQQFSAMWEHICKLSAKHIVESLTWNTANPVPPATYEQAYINAENFMQKQGANIIEKNVKNYAQYLSEEETAFIKALIG